ncbi:helix-turn-helix domain-containing protein [Streptosporangium sandarakinum]|uniref:helix-turn-helix domain-containing protein n=1 Tax=Streptosporangium sandarakinum TaxID=1260955 RepID=UPI00367DDBC8
MGGYFVTIRERARRLLETGETISAISRRTGVSRSTVKGRRDDRDSPAAKVASRPRGETIPAPPDAYAYLLGLYLRGGHINPIGDKSKNVWSLRIMCTDSWPGLQEECAKALLAARPDDKVRRLPRQGRTEIDSFSEHRPHPFPRRGPDGVTRRGRHGTGRRGIRPGRVNKGGGTRFGRGWGPGGGTGLGGCEGPEGLRGHKTEIWRNMSVSEIPFSVTCSS